MQVLTNGLQLHLNGHIVSLTRRGGNVMCSSAGVGTLRIMEGAPLHATSWLRFPDSDVLPLSFTCLATCVVGECALRVTPHQAG